MRREMLEYLHKHSEKRNKNLKYDFMPEILEIIEKPAHSGGKVIIYGIALFIVFAMIWAGCSRVDVVVTANGQVIPQGNVSNINSNVSGTIKSINVSNGDYVNEGDILVEFDDAQAERQRNYISNQIEIYKAENEVYNQIFNGSKASEIDISKYDEDCKNSVNAIIENQKYYELNLEYKTGQMEADNTYLSMIGQENKAQISAKISENTLKLNELNIELSHIEETINNMKVLAPVSGNILEVSVNTIGTYVNNSQQLLTIISDQSPLVVECYVSDKDIADVKCGQDVAIKISAFPYSDYGTLKGKVSKMSAGASYIENHGNVCVVEVEITDDKGFWLTSGMSASIEMKLGKRSVLEYLFEPVMNNFNNSLKEK